MDKKKMSLGGRLASSEAFVSVAASLICIVIGLLLGTVVLALINAEHAVFETLCRFENDEDKLKKYTEVLYNQALLIEGRAIEDPVAYANAVAELLAL